MTKCRCYNCTRFITQNFPFSAFDTVDWVTGRTSSMLITPAPTIAEGSFLGSHCTTWSNFYKTGHLNKNQSTTNFSLLPILSAISENKWSKYLNFYQHSAPTLVTASRLLFSVSSNMIDLKRFAMGKMTLSMLRSSITTLCHASRYYLLFHREDCLSPTCTRQNCHVLCIKYYRKIQKCDISWALWHFSHLLQK